MYQIHSDIPLPAAKRSGAASLTRKYPLSDMAVGDSFAIPAPDADALRRNAQLAYFAVQNFRKRRGRQFRFSVRRQGDRVGVWRVA
jgi:hypothetical protein